MTTPEPRGSSSSTAATVPRSSGFSISLGAAKPKAGLSTNGFRKPIGFNASTNGTKRRAALDDSDSDDEHESRRPAKVQLVTGFGSDGAIAAERPQEEAGPLVIPALKNKDWREESRKKKGKGIYMPPEARQGQKQMTEADLREVVGNEPMKVGLQFAEKTTTSTMTNGDVETITTTTTATTSTTEIDMTDTPVVSKTEDQLALEALLQSSTGAPIQSTLTIARASTPEPDIPLNLNEDDAYRHDVASRPPMASLDDYAATPVEEFGAALLRGMGWKEGQAIGKNRGGESKPRIVERRAPMLGIGAKGLGAEEMGTWTQGKEKKGPYRPEKTYLPITLVDKNGNKVEEVNGKVLRKEVDKDWRVRDVNVRDYDEKEKSSSSSSRRDRDYDEKERSSTSSRWDRDRNNGKDRTKDRSRDRRDRDKDSGRDRDRRDGDGSIDRTKDKYRSSRDGDRDRRSRDDGKDRIRDKSRERSHRHRSRSRSAGRHSSRK